MSLSLNESQQKAVDHRRRHLLVLAGAGSGKTRTLIARAQSLLAEGIAPRRILLLTFTRKAAMEMIERLKRSGAPGADSIIAGTFHYFAMLMIRRHPDMFAQSKAMVIDRDEQESLMKLARAEINDPHKLLPKAGVLLDLFSYARNTYSYLEDYLEKHTPYSGIQAQNIIAALAGYQTKKETQGYLDFDDLLFYFLQKLDESSSACNFFKQAFDHILVDEVQDTNPLQWAILKQLAGPATLFCVGDDAQSIYAFRGADFRNVHEFQNRIPDSDVVKLEKNYRSSVEILDLANHILKKSPLHYDKHLESTRGRIAPIKVKDFFDGYEEARWIVSELKHSYEAYGEWRKHMVMMRSAVAGKMLEGLLIENKIPYIFIGGVGLLQSAHIKDLLAFCRAAVNHRDSLAWIRYLSLWDGLGERKSVTITLELEKYPDLAAADAGITLKFPHREQVFKACLENVRPGAAPPDILRRAVDVLGPILEKRYSESWSRRKRDFEVLIDLSKKFKSIVEFVETYTLDPISATLHERKETDDVLTLITIHSAKGTEADVCFLIQAQRGNFPHSRSLGDEDAEEEERRILYVALTRARDRLLITRANDHRRNRFYGGSEISASSPENAYFLDGIDHFIETDAKPAVDSLIKTFPFFRNPR